MATRSEEYLISLIHEIQKLPTETEWIELKCNNSNPQMIGEYISALSNSAALCEKPYAYLVWGLEDKNHAIIGTTFDYKNAKKGNEELENWLTRLCNPRLNLKFFEIQIENKKVVLLEIPMAERMPTSFAGEEFIRIGSVKQNLKSFPDKERALWKNFETTPFELRATQENLTEDEITNLLDFSKYYDKMNMPIPRNRTDILNDLVNEKFITKKTESHFDITNMGAILIAKDLKKFEKLSRKSIRVIWYKNNNRLETIREQEFSTGYAFSHEEVSNYIMTIIPQHEEIEGSTRKSVFSYPEIAIRELTANMMIHQDFEQRGTNPMVEIFSDRIEFSNPGIPLVNINRIVDTVPVSRNENIASFMHKCGICEERGSGYDKIIQSTSENKMLAPKIEIQENQFTKVILFKKAPFETLTKESRVRTCYLQACLAYVNFSAITNSDIRNLFGLSENESYKSSRIIKDALDENLIKPVDTETAPRYMRYIPTWA